MNIFEKRESCRKLICLFFFFWTFIFTRNLFLLLFICYTKGSSPDQQNFFRKEGDKVELDCRPAADSPLPAEIFWYKYNMPIQDISYRTFTADVLNLSKMTLDNLLVADSGNYSCYFNNAETSSRTFNRTFILQVFHGEFYHSFIKMSCFLLAIGFIICGVRSF